MRTSLLSFSLFLTVASFSWKWDYFLTDAVTTTAQKWWLHWWSSVPVLPDTPRCLMSRKKTWQIQSELFYVILPRGSCRLSVCLSMPAFFSSSPHILVCSSEIAQPLHGRLRSMGISLCSLVVEDLSFSLSCIFTNSHLQYLQRGQLNSLLFFDSARVR